MKRSALGTLFLTVMIDLLGFGIVLPLLPRYADEFQASKPMIGLLMASFSAMQFVFAPIWGRLSDRYGRRPLIMLGLAGSVVSYLIFAFANTFLLLLLSRMAAGVFASTIGTAQAYIADVTGREDRGRQMALIGAAFGVGFTLGPSVGGLSHDFLGPSAPGLVAAALSLVALVMAWRVLPEPERHLPPQDRTWFDFGAVRHAFSIPTVPLILTLQFVATFCFANFESTLALFTQVRWNYDIRANGFIFTYVGFWLMLSQGFLVRRFMPRVGETRFAVLGCLILVAGLAALAFSHASPLIILPIGVLGFSMLSPSLSSLLSLRTPQETQGEILGLGQSNLALARILGPAVGLSLFAVSPETPYLFAAGGMAVASLGSLLLLFAPRPEPI